MNLNFLKMCLIYLFNFEQISSLKKTDCSSIVTSNIVSYIGCKEYIRTDSLSYPTKDFIPIYSFKGIPYAEPPVGSLRFRKTVPKTYSKPTTIDTTHYGNPCMQPLPIDFPLPSGIISEDCLNLNVWTPTLDSSANLPVMFWIHGGSFSIGSGSQFFALFLSRSNIYDGSQLALRDVVIVAINYRLGIFGFLYGGSEEAPGNMGYWDQAMALNWTKHNIQAFGGNPNDITLFGESAGSISISNHIVSNVTRNWFQRAIMQSGSAYIKLFSRDRGYSLQISRRFASNPKLFKTGSCNNDYNWIECLRSKSSVELHLAQVSSIIWNPFKPWYAVWMQEFCPIFGDEFIPISVNEAVRKGNFREDIKILIGHSEMEGALFTAGFDIIRGLLGRYIPFIPKAPVISKNIVFNDIRKVFFDNDTIGIFIANKFTETFSANPYLLDQNGIRRSAVHSFGDYFLTCPTILFGGHIVTHSSFKGKVYQYRLTYANSQSMSKLSIWADVTHTDELALLFGLPFRKIDNKFWSKYDRKLSTEIMDIWTHFAKYDQLPVVNGNVWPEYSLNYDQSVNASYIELHAKNSRMGKVHVNQYRINHELNPPFIGDCFYFWDEILTGQF